MIYYYDYLLASICLTSRSHKKLQTLTFIKESIEFLIFTNMVLCLLEYTQGFLTPHSFHSTSLATWGSSWGSKEAKFIKEFDFLGFSRCFSSKIEKSSKTSKIQPNCVIFRWFFEFCSILTEKQRLKPRKSNFLVNFASLDTQLDPHLARLVEIYQVLHFALKFNNSSAPCNFL